MNIYADTPIKVGKVVEACRRAFERGEAVGLDTEFFGVDLGKQSCVARSKLHLLSLAVARFPVEVSPFGFPVADAAVFTRESLQCREVQELLCGKGPWAVHNLPVDAHTLANEGIALAGGVNTLTLARYCWPERARDAGFTLDSLGRDFCGVGKTIKYKELFSEMQTEYRIRTKRVIECECGAKPCRRRASTPGHQRLERLVETRIPKEVEVEVPLETVVPGHEKWTEAVEYSAQDAVLALNIYNLAQRHLQAVTVDVPWL